MEMIKVCKYYRYDYIYLFIKVELLITETISALKIDLKEYKVRCILQEMHY